MELNNVLVHYQKIPQCIKNGEGGLEAQMRMAPEERKRDVDRFLMSAQEARKGAVLILLFPFQGSTYISLIRRQSYKGVHSGQISFPGGKAEQSDTDLLHTALRESMEEIAIQPTLVKAPIELSSIYIPPSNFLVQPFVAYSTQLPNFIADTREVDEILFLPLQEIWEEHRIKIGDFKSGDFLVKNYPYYEFSIGKVWGATAMILSELAVLLNPNKVALQINENN